MYDYVIRGGTIVDGTGAPSYVGDLAIQGDRIAAIGVVEGTGAVEFDAAGRAVAPGFIDVHTHYDAQMFWDPDLTPSSWHGITTVVSGNCGFGLAPIRPEHRETMCQVLAGVEGMDLASLRTGIPWERYETFAEYLDLLESLPLTLNVGVLAGHTTLRLYAMGQDSMERAATPEELEAMAGLLRDMLAEGAMGFSTSRETSHRSLDGRVAPSLVAELDELMRLCDVVGESGAGVIEITPGFPGRGLPNETLNEIARRTGRPLTWVALLTGKYSREEARRALDETMGTGAEVWAQIGCKPMMFQVTLGDPYAFNNVPIFEELVRLDHDGRRQLYADGAWVVEAGRQITALRGEGMWATMFVQESTVHPDLVDGPRLSDLAEKAGVTPFEVMVELSLAEDLRTRFGVILANGDEAGVAELLQDERCLLGISDAGAHANQLCDASYPTDLLGHWCRDLGALSLEQAVWRLTSHPAAVFGVVDRGELRAGAYADVVVFDPGAVAEGPLERIADQPAGAERLVHRSEGIEATWINGAQVVGGPATAVHPGRVLRSGA